MCGKMGGGGHGAMGIAGIAGKAGREDGEGVSLEIGEIAPGKTRRSDGHGWKGWGRGKGRSKGTFRCQREPEDSQQETPNRGGILAGPGIPKFPAPLEMGTAPIPEDPQTPSAWDEGVDLR